ncbi:hypothetical protein VNO77_05874 [Canavalia gladiata]|uniref:Uncharacterized protein n=1 Tax=Canavalia gladiata TaxID=3824 RepID=A0AAN9R925_CANGL
MSTTQEAECNNPFACRVSVKTVEICLACVCISRYWRIGPRYPNSFTSTNLLEKLVSLELQSMGYVQTVFMYIIKSLGKEIAP